MKHILTLLLALVFTLQSHAADLAADIEAKLGAADKPFTLIVELPISGELATEFKDIVKAVKAQEPRTLLYTALREAGTTGGITVVETYADIAAFKTHLSQPYITAFIAKLEAAKVEAKIRIMADAN